MIITTLSSQVDGEVNNAQAVFNKLVSSHAFAFGVPPIFNQIGGSVTDLGFISKEMNALQSILLPNKVGTFNAGNGIVADYGDVAKRLSGLPTTLSRASTATYIDANGILQTAGVNVPRYQGGALLVEGAATNLLKYSSQFDNAAWTKNSTTVTPNTDVAPDGTTTMDTLTGTNATTSYIQQTVTGLTAGAIYNVSGFVKAGSSPSSFLTIYDSSISTIISRAAIVWSGGVPSLGSVVGTWNTTPTFTEVGTTGIYRVSGSFNTGTFAGIGVLIYPASANTATTLKVWGFQLEAGPVATSYIPTTSAAATRAADILS